MEASEIYREFSKGQITRDEALSLISQYANNKPQRLELSEGEKGMWALYHMSPESFAYNTPGALILAPEVDLAALKETFQYLIDFHPALRTVFPFGERGGPYRMIRERGELSFQQFNLGERIEEEAERRIWEEVKRPLDLENGPLMRVCLFDVSPAKKILLMNFHHIIFDGISSQIFLREMKECYFALKEGKTPQLKERKAVYDDFVISEKAYLKSKRAEEDRLYWLNRLPGNIPLLDIPSLELHPKDIKMFEGASYSVALTKELVDKLKKLNTSKQVTLFSIMLSAYMALLSRYTNQNDIYIGTPVAGRNDSRFEDLLGYFINMIIIKNEALSEKRLLFLVDEIHEIVMEAFEHSEYPYSTLVKEYSRLHKKEIHQLFQAAFYFQNWLKEETDEVFLDYLHHIHQIGEFDLVLEVIETDDQCLLHFKYNPGLFGEEVIRQLAIGYRQVLQAFIECPDLKISEVSLLTAEERGRMFTEWNNTQTEYPKDKGFADLFAEQARKTPDTIAVVFENQKLTYHELYEKSLTLAYYLRQKGIQKGMFIGIFLNRSLDLLIALIASQMTGGVYIPLDPAYPADRLAYMFKKSGLSFLISQSTLNERLPDSGLTIINLDTEAANIENMAQELSNEELPVKLQPDDLVYAIFTSGSTGNPKGIMVHHGGLTNFLLSMAKTPGCGSNDYVFALTTICFDIAGLELYLPLVVGATVEILSDEIAKDGVLLLEKLEKSDVTLMQATPATWQMLLAAGWEKSKNFKILCGGEALSSELSDKLLDLSNEVWNMYGPTETTIWSSVSKVERGKKVSIGLPIANTKFYILDELLKPVPARTPGELYIGGDGVAKGYINQKEETEKKFLKDPFVEDKASVMYKTGDLVRYLEDGTIEYIGRVDFQVKINGFRIELGEIESVLLKADSVNEAVVAVREEQPGSKELVAFLIANDIAKLPSKSMVRESVRKALPEYMVPSKYIFLKAFPLTLNRKVDRKALSSGALSKLMEAYGAETEAKDFSGKAERAKPENRQKNAVGVHNRPMKDVEEFLKDCIAEIKRIPKESILGTVNLGEYGFDSISFTSLSLKLNTYYQIKTNPTLFYTYQTVQSFAEYLAANYDQEIAVKHPIREENRDPITIINDENAAKKELSLLADNVPKVINESYQGDIAIIGMNGILPGSEDLDVFWNNILEGKDLIVEIPSDRWDWRKYYYEPDGSSNKIDSKWGGFIKDIDKFDAAFFGISPREAELMDPQQRIMLEVVWGTIENAGYKPSDYSGTNMGVFIGATSTDYSEMLLREAEIGPHTISGIVNAIIPNRISYLYNFNGPSELIDTACSSALVGLCRAVNAIRSGACETAIAGGVNLLISPFPYIALSKTNMLSKDGRCKVFDKSANGYVRGEGGVAVLLKPLEKAVESNDHIYAVIKGVAVNHGGKTNSLTAPNPNAQKELIKTAFQNGGIDPSTVGYIEAHGTGTSLGDPIEINGLKMAFQDLYHLWNSNPAVKTHCGLGSVKSNIGHLEAVSGLAGLIKVALSLSNARIPATIHLQELNPYISMEDSPFYIVRKTQEWERVRDSNGDTAPLRGGVSSFGFGGTNAHVVLEEYRQNTAPVDSDYGPVIIILSARDQKSLKKYAQNMLQYLKNLRLDKKNGWDSDILKRIAYTLQIGREPMKERLALVGSTAPELIDKLELYLAENEAIDNLFIATGKNIAEFLGLVLNRKEIEGFVNQCVLKGDKVKVAKLWVNGVHIDWDNMYGSHKPQRVALPTYPFNKERYWISKSSDYHRYGQNTIRRPFIDGIVPEKSVKQGLVFRKVFRASDLIVKDHVVNSQNIFPGTGHLEIIVEAASFIGADCQFKIKHLVWQRPLVLEGDQPFEINLSLTEKGPDFEYQIVRISEKGNTIHSKGSISLETAKEPSQEEFVSIAEIKQRCSKLILKDEFYQWLANESGIEYGPYFQGIEAISSSDSEALGHIKLPAIYEHEKNDYYIHPVIMDCALQSMACLLGRGPGQGKTKVPFSVEEVTITEPLRAEEYYAYVVNAGKDIHNIVLLDGHGKVCAKFYHLVSREIKITHHKFFYCPKWVETAMADRAAENISREEDKNLIIYSDDSVSFKERLVKALDKSTVTEVKIANKTRIKSVTEWQVKPEDIHSYQQCITENKITKIYFLSGLVKKKPLIADIKSLEEKQEYGLFSFFHLIKTLSGIPREIQLVVVTNNTFAVTPDEQVIPINAGLSGFIKTVSLEYINLAVLLTDIEYHEAISLSQTESIAKAIVERAISSRQGEFALRNNTWYEKQMMNIALSKVKGTSFRKNGVYLIAGMGGIGFELGLYLAKRVQAGLIFIGRSPLDESRMGRIETLRAAGSRAEYIQADITDPKSMKDALQEIKSRFGALHGVFHAAMVLKDTRIDNMDERVLKEVTAPKTQGSIVLYNAVKDLPLDFMMFFSSANAFIGNAGQGNYNAACSFQDAFAASIYSQAKFPVKVINWSFWGSIGAVATEEYRKKLQEKGILSIETGEGMAVIESMLQSPLSQLIMFKASPTLLAALGFEHQKYLQVYPQSIPSVIKELRLKAELREDVKTALKTLQEGFERLEELGVHLVVKYFWENRCFQKSGEIHNKNELMGALGVIPVYHRLFASLLDMMEKHGLLRMKGESIESTELVASKNLGSKINNLEELKQQLKTAYPPLASYVDLLGVCAASYSAVLSGKKDHKEVMFPGGSKDLVQNIYKGNVVIDYYNEQVAGIVREYLEKRLAKEPSAQVNIVEIGAGTGGTSTFVLEKIYDLRERVTYFYTDISLSFTRYGQEKYGERFPFTRFKALDIEKSPEVQDFKPDSMDIVLATNVLHATNSIENTLMNIKSMLRTNGLIVINEITKFQNFSTLTFGLTGGWWNFSDDCRIKGSPLLTADLWKKELQVNGYHPVIITGFLDPKGDRNQSVIIAESDGKIIRSAEDKVELPTPVEKSSASSAGTGTAKTVSAKLETRAQESKASQKIEFTGKRLLEETEKYLKNKLATVLKTDESKLENDLVLDKLGVDSLIIIELNKEFGKDFAGLPATLLFEYNTINALTGYFMRDHKAELEKMFRVTDQSIESEPNSRGLFDVNQEVSEAEDGVMPDIETDEIPEEAAREEYRQGGPGNYIHREIAIVGVSGRYPMADTLDEFWENLKNGRNCIAEIPGDRWDWRKYYSPDVKPGMDYSKWGGFINDVAKFDAAFFEIGDEQAREMDPQERLFMEVVWSLLEDAGYPGKALSNRGDKVGVFVGTMYGAYGQIATKAWENGIHTNAQSAYWIIPNRISYFFNFTGPSIAIDTACSSSMTAIHYACNSIERGECNAAIAGGINLILHPRQHIRLANLNNLAKTDRTNSFSEDADGFVEGEGVGVVFLKTLEDAIRDNDYVYGIIKGSAVNSGGESSGFTAPNISAQADVIEQAIKASGINPKTINYIEAHATGTVLGDPIEITALNKVFSKYTREKQYCPVGTVKSNIGHLEAASGISALTKVLLQIRYGKLAPSINIKQINPYIEFEKTPFYIQRELSDWKQYADVEEGETRLLPRRAGISSFGAGGANAHLIIEEYLKKASAKRSANGMGLILISAKNEKSLDGYVKELHDYLNKRNQTGEEELLLADIAYTLQVGRVAMEERLAILASGLDELLGKLQDFCDKKEGLPGIYRGRVAKRTSQTVIDEKSSLEEIAQLWVHGGVYPWDSLYNQESKPKRVPLPTYCFDRQRYWVDSDNGAAVENIYSVAYEYNEPYVKDHSSFGKRTLLGFTYCSMAYEGLLKNRNTAPVIHFRNFLFAQPLAVNEEGKAEVVINLIKDKDQLFVESKSGSKTGDLETLARGEIIAGEAINPYSVQIPSFQSQARIPGSALYLRKPGVYGPSLHVIDETLVLGNEVWGRLSLTDEMLNDFHHYSVHPALLDGAALCRLSLTSHQEMDSLVPLMIKEMYIFSPLPRLCYCRLKEVKVNSEIWEGNVELFDENGKMLVLMQGTICKKVWMEGNERPESIGDNNRLELSARKKSGASKLDKVIGEYLAGKIAALLKENPLNIDLDKNIMAMGLDSTSLITLSREIQDALDVALYPTLFFEYQNINDLASYFAHKYPEKFTNLINNEDSLTFIPESIPESVNRIYPFSGLKRIPEEFRANTGDFYNQDEPIAIIGMSGIMPQSDDLDDFWEKIKSERNLVVEIPKDRWDWKEYYKESPDDHNKTKVIWGGFLKEVDKFDPGFFGLSPREARLMDPQQRISLELAWKAIEDAGYNPKDLSGSKTGVFIGVAGHDYSDIVSQSAAENLSQALTGNAHNVLTGRISYLLNFHGPSEPIDNACASSLVAIHHAVEYLRNGECELALAGGINIITSPSLHISFDNVGILSQDGKCRAFDKSADGTVRGEGAGLVLLKPLSRAIADRDHIYALIRGSAVNHGGQASSLTAPNPVQQAEVIVAAFEGGNIDPETVTYIEAHGTGTALGDPVEINGLKSAFEKLYSQRNKSVTRGNCAIGALKTNIGHLETAAGIAGIIKILFCMRHGILPGLVNFQELNPYIQFEGSPFYLVEKTQPWKRIGDQSGQKAPYRAGVSSFGFSGVNAHIVLEEYHNPQPVEAKNGNELIVLSAQTEECLTEYLRLLYQFLKKRMSNQAQFDQESIRGQLTRDIIAILARILKLPEQDVSAEISFAEFGFEPQKLVTFTSEINMRYGIKLDLPAFGLEICATDLAGILCGFAEVGRYYGGATGNSIPEKGGLGEFSLRQIAYTLQTGRAALEERIAIIVKDAGELVEKLAKLLAGEANIAQVYRGNIKQRNAVATIDPEWNADLEKLAGMWVAGANIKDWGRLYPEGTPQKVSLPTYPFARKRYWATQDESAGNKKPKKEAGALTSLIDSNESTLERQCYKKLLRAEDFYLRDHIVNGERILPGVVYIEMARMAGNLGYPQGQVVSIRNIVWTKPVKVQGEASEVWLTLYPENEGASYQIGTEDGNVYSQGAVIYGRLDEDPKERIDIFAVKQRCGDSLRHDAFYDLFKQAGFDYGSSFTPITAIYFNDREALSEIKLGENLAPTFDSFWLHPVLLEGALQTAGYLLNMESRPTTPYIPFSLGAIEIHGKLPQKCFAYATFSPNAGDGGVKKMEAALLDESGYVLVKAKEYTARAMVKESLELAVKNEESTPVATGDNEEVFDEFQAAMANIIGGIVEMEATQISYSGRLENYGVDSILLTELTNKINAKFGLDLLPGIFFEVADLTINNITRYLFAKQQDRLMAYFTSLPRTNGAPAIQLEKREVGTGLLKGRPLQKLIGGTERFNLSGSGSNEPIAIIGMSGRMPQSRNLDEFWSNLSANRDLITEVPGDRFDWRKYYGDPAQDNKTNSKWGGFMKEVDKFDASFFNISPTEAMLMDPQQRIFFETVWETIEDAGYKASDLSGSKTGVYLGVSNLDYSDVLLNSRVEALTMTGNNHPMIVNKISYFLNLSGPSEPIDTLCSSSLVSIHRAVEDMHNGICDMAIAGGINVILSPKLYISYGNASMLSPDGKCKTFDKSANGFVRGEGVGVLLLKPLSKAIADNDNIYAVIKGTAVNHCGHSKSLTSPNPLAQAEVIKMAFKKAGLDPATVSYIETHGTGTPLGDPVEVNGLKIAFADLYQEFNRELSPTPVCGLGSVKSNVGHLESAAGIAGVMKILMAMKHQTIPGNLHFNELNPYIDLKDSPFYIASSNRRWEQLRDENNAAIPRRAGISSFGAGGVNAHILFEEFSRQEVGPAYTTETPCLFLLSALSQERLKTYTETVINYLENTEHSLANIAYTSRMSREAMDERLAVVAASKTELVGKLKDYLREKRDQVFTGNIYDNNTFSHPAKKEAEYQNELIKTKNLAELGRCWVNGSKIDWRQLDENAAFLRVDFPKYPFKKDRHWVSQVAELASGYRAPLPQSGTSLHPLVKANVSSLNQVKFTAAFESRDFFIRDHVINGQKMLPGVIYLELARAVGELAGEKQVRELKDIVWLKPITLEDEGQEALVILTSVGNERNLIHFEVKSLGVDGNQNIHCQGKMLYEVEGEIPENPYSLNEIRNRCQTEEPGQKYYEFFNKIGFSYGGSFQTVTKVYGGDREVLVQLELPPEAKENRSAFLLHPSMMDGVLQAAMIMGLNEHDDMVYLPYSLGSLKWKGPIPEKCFAYVTHGEHREAMKNAKQYSLYLLDETGNVLVNFTNFIKKAAMISPNDTASVLYCRPIWYKAPFAAEEPLAPLAGDLVVLGTDNSILEEWKRRIGTQARLVSVIPGDSFRVSGNLTYQINPLRPEDYESLWNTLKDEGIKPANVVCSFVSAVRDSNGDSASFYSVFNLVASLTRAMGRQPVKLLYVYSHNSDVPYAYHASITAFLKSVMLENPNFKGISVEVAGSPVYVEQCLNEMKQDTEQPVREVRYEDGLRYGKKLMEFDMIPSPDPKVFKENGVYIISGGAGGVGLQLCRYLLKQYRAKLVLFGRSALTFEKEQSFNELIALGGELVYLVGDVSKKEDVIGVVNAAKERFGKINGVFHMAGVIRDSYLLRKTVEQMEKVLAPKIAGTLYLDEFTKDQPLDFFVLFSSISGIIGNVGQSDYSYANSFMDNFAGIREQQRRSGQRFGQTVSINWPLWRDGGMSIDSRTEEAMLKNTGLGAIDTSKALWILENGIGSTENNFMVLAGELKRLRDLFGIEKEVAFEENNVPETQSKINGEKLLQLTINLLKEVISKVNNLPVENIREKVPLEKYGIDSILILKLSTELEQYFGSLSKNLFFEYQNILELSNYFVENFEDKLLSIFNLPDEKAADSLNPIETKPEAVNVENIQTSIAVVMDDGAWPQRPTADQDDIAIVGVSGKYPLADTLAEFWENLKNGINCITEIPKERWDGDKYYAPDKEELGKSYSKWGGFIKEVDKFDPYFFNISPAEAEMMDPQERILLETVWAVLEDAGYTRKQLGSNVGVFVGSMYKHYPWVAKETEMGSLLSSTSYWAIANRISYVFNFQGPSLAVDTACSSSLTAIHLACESIKRGECAAAIAGGINLSIHPDKYVGLSQTRMIGSSDRSKSFSDGDGYVMGEGVGAVLLKPLSQAIKDQDIIYGVIRYHLANHGGKTNGFAVPNPNAQADLIAKVLKGSNIPVETISYIECAANGSLLGDMIEVNALIKAFKQFTKAKGFIPIGTVKANIGHLEAASGISQLTKVLLQMKHQKLIPTINVNPLNPNISLQDSPFYIQDALTDWSTVNGEPRRALISSFGAGGANTSIIVEEYRGEALRSTSSAQWPLLWVMSAPTEERLKVLVAKMFDFLQAFPQINLHDVAYTLICGREWMRSRLAIIGASRDDILAKLRAYLENGAKQPGIYYKYLDEDPLYAMNDLEYDSGIDVEINQLAQQWVNGVARDYDKTPQCEGCRRISLPGYSFARERYWITDTQVIQPAEAASSKAANLEEDVENTLREIVAQITKIPRDKLDLDESFTKYGFDSLSGLRFINVIKQKYGKKLSINAFFENPTIRKLALYLIKERIVTDNQRATTGNHDGDNNKRIMEMILRSVESGELLPNDALELQKKLIKNR